MAYLTFKTYDTETIKDFAEFYRWFEAFEINLPSEQRVKATN